MKKGSAALTAVIILSAIMISTGLTLTLVAVDNTRVTSMMRSTSQAESYAMSCVEEALRTIKGDNNYTGEVSINSVNINCTATISDISEGEYDKKVVAEGVVDEYTRTITKKVDIDEEVFIVD